MSPRGCVTKVAGFGIGLGMIAGVGFGFESVIGLNDAPEIKPPVTSLGHAVTAETVTLDPNAVNDKASVLPDAVKKALGSVVWVSTSTPFYQKTGNGIRIDHGRDENGVSKQDVLTAASVVDIATKQSDCGDIQIASTDRFVGSTRYRSPDLRTENKATVALQLGDTTRKEPTAQFAEADLNVGAIAYFAGYEGVNGKNSSPLNRDGTENLAVRAVKALGKTNTGFDMYLDERGQNLGNRPGDTSTPGDNYAGSAIFNNEGKVVSMVIDSKTVNADQVLRYANVKVPDGTYTVKWAVPVRAESAQANINALNIARACGSNALSGLLSQ